MSADSNDPTPHDTTYDATTAFWIAILGVFIIGTVIAIPWMMDSSWYGVSYGTTTTAIAYPKVEYRKPPRQAMAVMSGGPLPVAPPQPMPSYTVATSVKVDAVASAGGVVISCRPNLAGMKA